MAGAAGRAYYGRVAGAVRVTTRTVVVAFRLEASDAETLRRVAEVNRATVGEFVRAVIGDLVAEWVECQSLAPSVNTPTIHAGQ